MVSWEVLERWKSLKFGRSLRREGGCVRKSNLEKRSQGGAHIEKNAALKLDEKRELAFLEKPFDGFYVTFADQNID